MQPIKAIDTAYNGYLFRSRLEARWAVWLDAIGWEWEYEPEGIDLGDGTLYLPDFRVDRNFWLEIKPCMPNREEIRKANLLASAYQGPVLFGIGTPDPYEICEGSLSTRGGDVGEHTIITADTPLDRGWYNMSYYCFEKWGTLGYGVSCSVSQRDIYAATQARSARFEHDSRSAMSAIKARRIEPVSTFTPVPYSEAEVAALEAKYAGFMS